MSKFYGPVGFGLAKEIETAPDVYETMLEERFYYGDIIINSFKSEQSNAVNDDIKVNNRISIVADPYAQRNFNEIKYVKWNGISWKVVMVEEKYPRLILYLGGVYVKPN